MKQKNTLLNGNPKKSALLGATTLLTLFVLLKWDAGDYQFNAVDSNAKKIELNVDVEQVHHMNESSDQESPTARVKKKRKNWHSMKRSVALFGDVIGIENIDLTKSGYAAFCVA